MEKCRQGLGHNAGNTDKRAATAGDMFGWLDNKSNAYCRWLNAGSLDQAAQTARQ